MEWSEIALPVGSPPADLGLHLNFVLPEPLVEGSATDRQAEAVRLFYETDFGDISACQAHTLLSCREYARLCAEALFKKLPSSVRHLMARAIAAYILSDKEITQYARIWSDRNFERGTGSPRVRGTPFFSDIEAFASYLDGMLEMNGWDSKHLKNLR